MLVSQSCLALCDPMDCSPSGSSVHEIFQVRILEWVAISFSRGSSQPRDRTRVSCTAGGFFTDWATREARYINIYTHTHARCLCSLSHVHLFATPWTVACWVPLPMGVSRQEYWSGWPYPSPEDLPNPGNPGILHFGIPGRFFSTEPPGESHTYTLMDTIDD